MASFVHMDPAVPGTKIWELCSYLIKNKTLFFTPFRVGILMLANKSSLIPVNKDNPYAFPT